MSLQSAYGSGAPKDWSLTEFLTGDKWIDGKPIWQKYLSLGTLPNAILATTAHGITGLDTMINIEAHVKTSGTFSTPLNFVQTGGIDAVDGIGIQRNGANIEVQPGNQDRSPLSGFCILTYTKT